MLKGKRLIIGLAVLSLVLFLSNQKLARSGQEPSLEDQIEEAVAKGLNFLANQQNADGSWGFSEKVGRTGLILLKFEDRAIDLGYSPLDPDYEYSEIVSLGLDFLMSRMTTQTIGVQPAGNPDGDGDGIGVYFADSYGHSIYGTGITMMALAASGDPATYGDYVQDALDWMAWAQADDYCGNHRRG